MLQAVKSVANAPRFQSGDVSSVGTVVSNLYNDNHY